MPLQKPPHLTDDQWWIVKRNITTSIYKIKQFEMSNLRASDQYNYMKQLEGKIQEVINYNYDPRAH